MYNWRRSLPGAPTGGTDAGGYATDSRPDGRDRKRPLIGGQEAEHGPFAQLRGKQPCRGLRDSQVLQARQCESCIFGQVQKRPSAECAARGRTPRLEPRPFASHGMAGDGVRCVDRLRQTMPGDELRSGNENGWERFARSGAPSALNPAGHPNGSPGRSHPQSKRRGFPGVPNSIETSGYCSRNAGSLLTMQASEG